MPCKALLIAQYLLHRMTRDDSREMVSRQNTQNRGMDANPLGLRLASGRTTPRLFRKRGVTNKDSTKVKEAEEESNIIHLER